MPKVVFEDKQVERSVTDVIKSPGFRRLKQHITDEVNSPDGTPIPLADALAAAFREALLDGYEISEVPEPTL